MRTKNIFLLLLASFFLALSADAQIKFRKVIGTAGGYDYGVSAQQTIDKGYVAVGSTSSFGAGGTDVYLVKTDSFGVPFLDRTFGGINIERGTCVKQTADKGYIISGYTNSFGAGGYDVYLIKIDSTYGITWTKTYGGTDWDFGNCVEQTSDGGYIICGETYSYGKGDEDYYLIKTDMNGDTLWTKTYGGTNKDVARSIIQTSDGGYIVTGTTKSMGDVNGDIYTIKTDSMGDTLWTNKFGGPLGDDGNDIIESMYGYYVVTGGTKSFGTGGGTDDGIIFKISSLGVTGTNMTLGAAQDDNFQSITEDGSGKISMVGKTVSYGDGGGNGDVFLWTLKSDWSYYGLTTFGSLNADIGYSVEPTMDSAFILCGTTNGFNSGIDDIYLIKTDTLCLASVPENNFYTGVDQHTDMNTERLKVYPNPAANELNISLLSFHKNTTIDVFDSLGKKVITETVDADQNQLIAIDLSTLSNGIYFLKIADNKISEAQKIIVEK